MAKHDLKGSKETKVIEFEIEPDILAQLTVLALEQKVTVETLIKEAITEALSKWRKGGC